MATHGVDSSTQLEKFAKENLKVVLELNEALRQDLVKVPDVKVPSIVVIGDQSHGKTSVVEGLCGFALPRGEGMTTKLPLCIHIRQDLERAGRVELSYKNGEEEKKEEFSSSETSEKVDQATREILGEKVSIADNELHLKVYLNSTTEFDLIDLPGMTRVTKDDANIEEKIKELYTKYMHEKAVFLNVNSFDVDSGNAMSMKMCRKLDSHGKRTILCHTKVDISTSKGNLSEKIVEKIKKDSEEVSIPAEKIVFVRNRSSNSVDEAFENSLANEDKFFQEKVPESVREKVNLGKARLAEMLSSTQRRLLLEELPNIREKIESKLTSLKEKAEGFPPVVQDHQEAALRLKELIDKARQLMRDDREGRETSSPNEASMVSVTVGHSGVGKESTEKNGFKLTSRCKEKNDGTYVSAKLSTTNLKRKQDWSCDLVFDRELSDDESDSDTGELDSDNGELDEYSDDESDESDESDEDESGVLTKKTVRVKSLSTSIQVTANVSRTYCTTSNDFLECSKMANLDEDFGKQVRHCNPKAFFLSNFFLREMERRYNRVKGQMGLPGELSGLVAREMAIELQRKDLYPLATHFAQKVFAESENWTMSVLNTVFKGFPKVLKVVKEEVASFLRSQKKTLDKKLEQCESETDLCTLEDHYVNSIKEDLQREIRRAKKGRRSCAGSLKTNLLNGLSVYQHAVLLKVVDICAYWKAMKKHFAQRTIQSCKLEFFSEKFEDAFINALGAVAHRKDIFELISLDASSLQKIHVVNSQIHALEEALKKCDDFSAKSNVSL